MAIRYTLHTHTHTRLTALFPGAEWAGTRKVKPIWILVKQETLSGSGISWTICKSASHSRQITMPVPHQSRFLQARCPSCRPTNSVKALKAIGIHCNGMLFALCCFVQFSSVDKCLECMHYTYMQNERRRQNYNVFHWRLQCTWVCDVCIIVN